jgi:hypothetical protein
MANIIIKQNPNYKASVGMYKYYRDHFNGGKGYAQCSDDYLPKFSQEDDAAYLARKLRSIYINYCEAVISIYQSAIWKVSPVRLLPDKVEAITGNVDRLGTDANSFFPHVTEQAQAIGIHYVLVDAPRREEGKTYTVDEAAVNKMFPYLVSIPAENVTAWQIEMTDPARIGEFNFLVIEESFYHSESPFTEPVIKKKILIFYPDRCQEYEEVKGVVSLVSESVNQIGKVPVIPFYGRRKGFMVGESDLKAIAPLAQKVAEWLSWLDEDMIYHALRQLVIKTNADIEEIGIGSNRAIRLSPDSGEDAFILESQGNASTELWVSISKIQELIYRLATNQIATIKDTAQVASAESKKIDSRELESLLMKKAGSFEQSEIAVWQMVALFMGVDAEKITVEYHRNFTVSSRDMAEWEQLIDKGVLSVLDWIMAEHTTIDSVEDAQAELDKNLKLRTQINDKVGLGDMLRTREQGAA